MSNNMGARHILHYRSSAQFWLDEKAAAVTTGKTVPSCHLPFALHTLWRTDIRDEITGNQLTHTARYRHGVWDALEREFRGFGFVEICDTDSTSLDTSGVCSPASVRRQWYATGLTEVDGRLHAEYWQGDDAAFEYFTPRFTSGCGEGETTLPDNTIQALSFWLHRAMKGIMLRSELYGVDGSDQAGIPYTVTEQRPQVRLVDAGGTYPVLWPAVTENRTYVYERLSDDPQCSQHIILHQDEYGQPLCQVSVNYPRRTRPAHSPYPASLPETLFAGSYDEQQQTLRLTQQQNSWHTLSDSAAGIRVTGLADGERHDVFTHPAAAVPTSGLTQEVLSERQMLVADGVAHTFAGQQQTFWQEKKNADIIATPAFPPLRAYTVTAMLDEACISGVSFVSQENRNTMLENAGYRQAAYLFARDGESAATLWVTYSGSTEYGNAGQFWRPLTYTTSPLTGKNTLTWDTHFCVVTAHRDAAGLTVSVRHDWRFMTPVQLTDENDNVHTITLDALGQVTTLHFHGTEHGQACGYSNRLLTVPTSAEEALTLLPRLPVHKCRVCITGSWMKTGTEKQPPHVVILTTDRYDGDPEQQIRQQVTFSDGFGRHLQTSVSHGGGLWAVTGRTEYDNKGQPVRTYQPHFSDTWRYMKDNGTLEMQYADTHYYDPTGREYKVITARGWQRRTLFTPWFVVSEDENDTQDDKSAGESLPSAALLPPGDKH